MINTILAGLGIGSLAAQTIIGGVTDSKNIDIQKQNLALQKDNLNYLKGVQEKTWSREDNAVQRRVADLKAAGLNPVLAAGSAANSGPIISTTAPQRESINLTSKFDQVQAAMALLKMKQDISTTVAQQKYLESQKEQSDSATKLNDIQTEIKKHDFKIYEKSGIASNASALGKIFGDINGIIGGTTVQSFWDQYKSKILQHVPKEVPKTKTFETIQEDKFNERAKKDNAVSARKG